MNIDPELQSIKAHKLPSNRWVLAALQRLLSIVNAVHRRKFRRLLTAVSIPSSDGYRCKALIVRPENAPVAGAALAAAPALVYYHGGAFVMKPAPQHMENAIRYAREAHCVVIFVEYRLAPRHPFPAGFDDCHAALHWTVSNAQMLRVDPTRIAVGGDSAGGGLAAGVAQRARQEGLSLCGQLLVYPVVDLTCSRPSITAFANVPPFREASTVAMAETYLGRPLSSDLPRYASPIQGEVSDLAPAYVETAQFDLLHDQGQAYAQILMEKHVDVELNEIAGGLHGFDLLAPASTIAKRAMQRRIQFLRRVLARPIPLPVT